MIQQLTEKKALMLEEYVREALLADDAEHKQWYLRRIGEILDVEMPGGSYGVQP